MDLLFCQIMQARIGGGCRVTSIIVALPKIEDAKNMKNLLVRSGYSVEAVCTSGLQVLAAADQLRDGIVVCGYKLTDMLYFELHENLPDDFEMLLMASQHLLVDCQDNDIICLAMPFQLRDLVNTVEMLGNSISYKRKKRKAQPRQRNSKEIALIKEAKLLLMDRNNMTEEEAHRYIQKTSMDNSTSMVETAQMVLSIMQE